MEKKRNFGRRWLKHSFGFGIVPNNMLYLTRKLYKEKGEDRILTFFLERTLT